MQQEMREKLSLLSNEEDEAHAFIVLVRGCS